MAEESNATISPSATGNRGEPTQVATEDKPSELTVNEGQNDPESEATKINGNVEHTADKTNSALSNEDTEMKDPDEEPTAGSGHAVGGTNGTPASKKASNGSAKKKTSGVPEHKTKKVNKRKSKSKLTHLDAQPGEHYLATMKGHPAWPAVICDEAMLPGSLLETRPVTTRRADGTFRKPEYDNGGKRAHERTFPVMFLSTNEFAWMPNTDLSPLDPSDCKNIEAKGKSKLLVSAYAVAAEDYDLHHYKTMLADHQAAVDADVEADAARDVKKASKSKRKSVDVSAVANDDEMDIDDEVPTEKPKSKKRKKDAQEEDETDQKPAKTPKTGTKLKLSTPKNPGTESSKKGSKAKASTSKKAKKVANSDDETMDTPKPEEPKLTPAERKEKSQKLVLFYRHKLQRGFLSRDTAPREEEMKDMSDFLKELEGYPDLDGSIIRATKIHKVLKAMLKLPTIPLDEEFKFIERSHELLKKWTEILAADPNGNQEEASGAGEAVASITNGDTNNTKPADDASAEPTIAPEEEEETLKNKIGTTTEGEDGGATKSEKTAEEKNTDAPAIDSAPAEEYKPPAEETVDEPST